MSGPLIPFIDGAQWEIPLPLIDGASIKPFGTLVAIGVYVGALITLSRAKERKLNTAVMNDFIFWVVATGFVLSHMLDAIFYHPETVARDPIYLLKIWAGLSSYGGFIGAVVGAVAWRMYRRKPILEYIDICVSAFPVAWIFGRTGCSIVHDHPGAITDAWFAVQYPNTVCPAGFAPDAVCGRYDLGLIEMVLTIPLAVLCMYLWRRKPLRASGFYVGVTLTAYAPVRFGLDFLRVDPGQKVFRGATDPRYAGLTPAQWACFLALAVGLYFLAKTWSADYTRTALGEKEGLSTEVGDEDEDDVEEALEAKPAQRKKKRRKKKKRPAADGDDATAATKPRKRKKKRAPKPEPAAEDDEVAESDPAPVSGDPAPVGA